MDLIKQPNGKYCSADYHGRVKFFNYTEQDVINIYVEQAKEDMKNAKHCGELIEKIENGDNCRAQRNVFDVDLELMGFDKPYNELVKFVLRRPLDTHYVSCDFATYGKCPNCGKSVQDGISYRDDKCRNCGQLLKW